MPKEIRDIIKRIVREMRGCKDQYGKPCNSHSVCFDHEDYEAAKAYLAANPE